MVLLIWNGFIGSTVVSKAFDHYKGNRFESWSSHKKIDLENLGMADYNNS